MSLPKGLRMVGQSDLPPKSTPIQIYQNILSSPNLVILICGDNIFPATVYNDAFSTKHFHNLFFSNQKVV